MAKRELKVFISSPGDVAAERLIAARVLDRLQVEFQQSALLEKILWEHEPLLATHHFQEQIPPPSAADIVVCILWSRLGTRLPQQFCRPDGTPYASGTEWEFEEAAEAYRKKGIPKLLVYRNTAPPTALLDNEEALLERLEQKRALDRFIDHWFGNPQDSFKAAYHTYHGADAFEAVLHAHLRKLVRELVGEERGGLPSIWNAPPRNLCFTGREATLVQLQAAL